MTYFFNKKILFLTLFFGCFFIQSNLLLAQEEEATKTLPNLHLTNLKGDTIAIQNLAQSGKITILKFWSAWTAQHCKPCELDMKSTAKLQKIWKENNKKVNLITISTDKGRNAAQLVKTFLETHQWNFEVLLDTEEGLQKALNLTDFVPCIVMFGEEGKVIYESFKSKEDYKVVLEQLLK